MTVNTPKRVDAEARPGSARRTERVSLKVYLAGPEVFLPNAREQLDRKIALTRAAGLIPVSPGDFVIPPQPTKRQLGHAISEIDERMMNEAGAIIANLTPYHGIGADTGTCYELGYMCAQGKIAYVHFRNVVGKAPNYTESFVDDGDVDMIQSLRIYHQNGYSGVIIPDHTPQMSCAAPWHAGMAFAMGWMKAVVTMLEQGA